MNPSAPQNQASKNRVTRFLSALLIGFALVFILAAAECTQETTFIDAQEEICGDGTDNDGDGRIDCKDSECELQCRLELTVNPTLTTSHDTQTVSGTHRNANRIVIEVQPSNSNGGTATLAANTWSFKVVGLQIGDNALNIVASDSLGATKNVQTTIKRLGE